MVSLPGYGILRNDRAGKIGGGVALYVHASLRAKVLAVSPSQYTHSPEFLIAEINSPSSPPFLVAVVYRPPKAANLAAFESAFDATSVAYSLSVVLGDFNANQLGQSYDADNVRDFCASRALYLVPFRATCHTHTSDTLLDLCLVSDQNTVLSFGQSSAPFIAGHDLISVELHTPAPPPGRRSFRARSFGSFDSDAFLGHLASADWSSFEAQNPVNGLLRCLQDNVTLALDRHAPYRVCTVKRSMPPWISPALTILTRARDSLYRSYKRLRTEISLARYREARDELHRLISAARSDFFASRLLAITKPRALWNELRDLGIAPAQGNDIGDFSVDELNSHFAAVSQRPGSSSEVRAFFADLPPACYSDEQLYFKDISPIVLQSAIRHFSSQSRGVDDLSLSNIQLALPVIFPYLLSLLNHSLSTSVFPESWKQARICPIGKVKSTTSLDQVRPISNLCMLSKIFERIVLEQITDYLEERNLLDPRQTGFRPGHNTQSALLRLTEDIRRGVDDRKVTILVLFDYSKAFDTLPHAILLTKLLGLGFSQHVLKWIASYLQDRVQAVSINGMSLSSWAPLDLGVPQGSVLGPLLFSLFVNDLSKVLRHTDHLLYADDLQIYLQCAPNDLPEAIAHLNQDIEAVSAWSRESSLRLNTKKTHALLIGSGSFVSKIDLLGLPSVMLDGQRISFTESARNLGLIIDNKLAWTAHINYISCRVHGTLRQLSASRRLLSKPLRKMLVTTLIFPIFDYCCVVYNDVSGILNTKLQRLLNTCVRFVCGVARDEHNTLFRRELGWLTIRDRRLFFLLSVFYTVVRTGRPSYLRDLLVERDAPVQRSQRLVRSQFIVPTPRTEFFKSSFAVAGVHHWDSLPADIKSAVSLQSFKRGLHVFLFSTEDAR